MTVPETGIKQKILRRQKDYGLKKNHLHFLKNIK